MTYEPAQWRRVSKRFPCPICGKDSYCGVSIGPEDGSSVVKCMRAESGKPFKQKDGAVGWIHELDAGRAKELKKLPKAAKGEYLKPKQIRDILKEYDKHLNDSILSNLAKSLNVSVKSLRTFGVGYDGFRKAFSFPMYDGTFTEAGKPQPCGIRLRYEDGGKGAVKGSRNGIFIPIGADPDPIPESICADPMPLILLMPEGPTDCCAAFDLGFRAIGRPNNSAGGDYIKLYLEHFKSIPMDVVIVADNDSPKYELKTGVPYWPGIEGAINVAEMLLPACGQLRFLLPPKKDLRAWLVDENAQPQLLAMLTNGHSAPRVSREWIAKARRRLAERKRREKKPV